MENYNFCYNYGFLADWLKANPKIKRYTVLENLDMSDYRTFQNWVEGLTMMPITQMMKFCNRYNVPVTAFFFDENADGTSIYSAIHDDAMTEPAGGWPDSQRKVGIKVCDPRTKIHYVTNLPAYIKDPKTQCADKETAEDDDKAAREQEKETSKEERMRYLDIIEQQNKKLLQLLEEVNTLREKLSQAERDDKRRNYGFVAEEEEKGHD